MRRKAGLKELAIGEAINVATEEHHLPSLERAAEIRELEVELEQSLLALDYAQHQQESTFAPAARVAEIQMQLEVLRGPVRADRERRAAWLAHLARLEECQVVHDGPAADGTPPVRRLTLPRRPTAGTIEFPQIN